MSSSKNKIFEITSFLSASNNDYINEMYKKFVNQDDDLPDSWKQYFDGLEEDNNQIKKNISGAHWKPQKVKINEDEFDRPTSIYALIDFLVYVLQKNVSPR